MSEYTMRVDTASLHAGADRLSDAAYTALTAVGKLAAQEPGMGIFGEFAEAIRRSQRRTETTSTS